MSFAAASAERVPTHAAGKNLQADQKERRAARDFLWACAHSQSSAVERTASSGLRGLAGRTKAPSIRAASVGDRRLVTQASRAGMRRLRGHDSRTSLCGRGTHGARNAAVAIAMLNVLIIWFLPILPVRRLCTRSHSAQINDRCHGWFRRPEAISAQIRRNCRVFPRLRETSRFSPRPSGSSREVRALPFAARPSPRAAPSAARNHRSAGCG